MTTPDALREKVARAMFAAHTRFICFEEMDEAGQEFHLAEADAAIRVVVEACAEVCEQQITGVDKVGTIEIPWKRGIRGYEAAKAIRALIPQAEKDKP